MKKRSLVFASAVLVLGLTVSFSQWQSASAVVPGTNVLADYDTTGASSGATNAHISEDGNTVVWTTTSHAIIAGDPYSSSHAVALYERNLQTGTTSYVALDSSGAPVAVDADHFAISRTGRYVAYSSPQTNIVSSPTVPSSPTQYHVYLRDMATGTTTLVDQTNSGVLANIGSNSGNAIPFATSVSDDGRFVTFGSVATNLLNSGNPSYPNYTWYYYLKDMQVSTVINPLLSSSGVRSNQPTGQAQTNCDGSFVLFSSAATNLTPNDNGKDNVFLVDLRNGYQITDLTYNANQGADSVSISCNGRYITMYSYSTNLTSDSVSGSIYHLFLYDRLTGTYSLVDKSTSGHIPTTQYPNWSTWPGFYDVSDNGLVAFSDDDTSLVSPAASDTNNEIYLRNPVAGTTELVGINSSGLEQSPALTTSFHTVEINAMGNAVMYDSDATNLISGVTAYGQKLVISKVQ